MKLFSDWGFTRQGWRTGEKGEYLTLLQGLLLVGFVVLPVYRWPGLSADSPWVYTIWAIALLCGMIAAVFFSKGLWDLGRNLTPLPYPKSDGQLVQSGVYSVVRHPLYSGLIFAALAWTLYQFSLSHAIATTILFIFLNIKANREEAWLSQKFPEYTEYQGRVKKLIPGAY